jgi:hypothetical protein
MTFRALERNILRMNPAPSPQMKKYVLIPMPRTDARPRRFALATVDPITRMPIVTGAPRRFGGL